MNRKKSGFLKRTLAVSLALTTAFSFGGCGKKEETKSNGKIAVICKAQGVSFWDYVKIGAEDAGEEMGYDIIYNCASKESNIDEQIGFINQAIAEDVKAIVIAPNSATELNATLKKAASKGIKIITINSDVKDFDNKVTCLASDNISCGNIAARQMASDLLNREETKNGGTIGIIGHSETSSTSLERISGLTDEFLENIFTVWHNYAENMPDTPVDDEGNTAYDLLPAEMQLAYDKGLTAAYAEDPTNKQKIHDYLLNEFSHFKFADTMYCDNDRETAKQQAAELISKNKDLVALYGTNTNSTLGICDAVKEAGLSSKILVIGFNSDTAEIDYLRNSTLTGLIVQSPYNMGYLGVRYADTALSGESVSELIDTGATYVYMGNISEKYIQLLLDPRSTL